MKTVLAIDPGPTQSAFVCLQGATDVIGHGLSENAVLVELLRSGGTWAMAPEVVLCERVESFGMAVGATIFETVFWTGRFAEAWLSRSGARNQFLRIGRRDVKLHLCGNSRAKDTNIRQAIIDRFGPGKEAAIGTKKSPGPLYGLRGHEFAALAVALTFMDRR